jgi:hypothetical protein
MSMKRCFIMSKSILMHFLHSGHWKPWFARIRGSNVLSTRMDLTTLSSGRLRNGLLWSSRNDISWCLKATQNHFLNSGHWSTRFGRRRGSDVLRKRMALDVLKKRLFRSRWSDDSMCWKAMRTHFLHPVLRKKRVWQSCLSDVSRWMALRTHNIQSGHLKKDFWEFDEARIQDFEGLWEVIFCLLAFEKKGLDKLVIFWLGEWAWELIICLQYVLKCDFGDD